MGRKSKKKAGAHIVKAWRLHGIGDIRFEEVDKPDIKENEVLVEVKAAGICGSDIPRIYKTGAYSHPLIPGHEFAGIVAETGKDADEKWIGKRVGIFPLIPCGICEPCSNKQYEMCRSYSYLGSRCDGGFAEYVAVPEKNLIEISENISYKEAAMLEPMAVAVHALRRVFISEQLDEVTILRKENLTDKSILIYGLGTIGLFLFMFLTEKGYKNVYVVGNKESQKRKVQELGLINGHYIDDVLIGRNEINSDTNDVVDLADSADILLKSGFDVCFECVGKNETMNKVVELAKPGGVVCLVGNPHSDMSFDKNLYWKILRNQLTIVGTWNSSFTKEESDDWNYVLRCLDERKIYPEKMITHIYELADAEKGFECMRDKLEDYIKIMIDLE